MSDDKKPSNPDVFPIGHKHGMSLRDWFAGQALPAILQTNDPRITKDNALEMTGRLAYAIADALLKSRETP